MKPRIWLIEHVIFLKEEDTICKSLLWDGIKQMDSQFYGIFGRNIYFKAWCFLFFKGKGVLILNCRSQACILKESTKKLMVFQRI
jgi:hypothetical protein